MHPNVKIQEVMKRTSLICFIASLLLVSCEENFNRGDGTSFADNGHKCIDLALPSGNLWATCNIGAQQPYDCGDYFAFGDTRTQKSFYPDSTTHYFSLTQQGELLPKHDAATAQWGKNWHTPTEADFKELIAHCNWILDTVYLTANQKVIGYYAQSKNNRNTIFLPVTGQNIENTVYPNKNLEFGTYWSNTLKPTGYAVALKFHCMGQQKGQIVTYDDFAHYGKAIRPVCKKTTKN